jgi:hypothetical protein
MNFELIGKLVEIEVIARGRGIRELDRLERDYGKGSWRKLKGVGNVKSMFGEFRKAELHWYEAHGRGKYELKVKRFLD